MSKRSDAAIRRREIVQRQARSGLSVAAFCRRLQIPQATFYVWRRKVREAAAFAEVRVAPDLAPRPTRDSATTSGIELVLAEGRRILVGPGFDRSTLLALLDALEQGTADDCGGAADGRSGESRA